MRARCELARASALAREARAPAIAEEALYSMAKQSAAVPPSMFWTIAQAYQMVGREHDAHGAIARGKEALAAQRRGLPSTADRRAFDQLPGNAELSAFARSGSRAV